MLRAIRRNPKARLTFFILIDVLSITLAIWLAFLIRFDGAIPVKYAIFLPRFIILAILVIIPIFYFQKLYSFSWSYVSASEAVSLFKATTISFIILGLALIYGFKIYLNYFEFFPRSTVLIGYILVFLFCSAIRFSKRIYLQTLGLNKKAGKRTLIVGAGDAGEQILRNITASKTKTYLPIGFVDDNPVKQGIKIHGVKVLGKILDIPEVVRDYQIKQLIVAIPSANNSLIEKAVALGRQAGLYKIKVAPPLSEIIQGEVSLKSLKNVDAENLLNRNPIVLDRRQIENFIKDNVVLITGAAGSIGSELVRQVSRFHPSVLAIVDQDETGIFNIEREVKDIIVEEEYKNKNYKTSVKSFIADISNEDKVRKIFKELKPQVIFHAAAYKHVPLMEAQPDEAVKNNIFGTLILVKASFEAKAEKFVLISTDKAVNPTSVMGATKRIGEMICQAYNQKQGTRFVSVRFGNVLDSRGSVIPIFREQIRRREEVTVTDPAMKRYFMLVTEACLLVMQAGAMGKGGEVFVLDMGQPVKILDLAKEMIRLSGLKINQDITIVFTGKRPGEKDFEEMLTAEEGTEVTQNQKIFMAKMSEVNFKELEKNIEELKNIVLAGDNEEVVNYLKTITPYYT